MDRDVLIVNACARHLGSRAGQDRKGGKRVSQKRGRAAGSRGGWGEGGGWGVGRSGGFEAPVGATNKRDP